MVEYPRLSAVQWILESQIIYTEKVVVATVSIIITISAESTWEPRTQTVYGYVPPEYSLYSLGTNEEGTAVVTIPIPQSDGVTFWSRFTYPTPYIDYSTEYHWQGVLQTHDKAFNPICETAIPVTANVPLRLHPEYPRPKGELSPGKIDPYGTESKPLWVPVKDEPDKSFFDVAFPSESAFSYCESIPASTSIPTQYAAPKFITEYTTVYTSPSTAGVVIIQPSATGWEETSRKCCAATPDIPRIMSSEEGWGLTSLLSTSITSLVNRIESTVTGLDPGDPGAQQTKSPGNPSNNKPPSIPDIIVSVINNNPGIFTPGNSGIPAGLAVPQVTPTPTFTFVPTIINGQSTTIPAFVLPGGVKTASIGETVTLNGQVTVLTAPPTFFTMVPTIINGMTNSIPAYIVSGTSTASLGQTLIIEGHLTVLSAPSITTSWVSTTINGTPTSIPVYIIDGTMTATIGQTVVIDGKSTILATMTSADGPNPGFEGPVATAFGPQATGDGGSRGSGAKVSKVSWSALIVGIGGLVLFWL